jgi:hypothetical protein
MEIDFNNVRRRAVDSFNELVKILNSETMCNRLSIDPDNLYEPIENLRQCLVGIACTYEPDNEKFQCVLKDGEVLEEYKPED